MGPNLEPKANESVSSATYKFKRLSIKRQKGNGMCYGKHNLDVCRAFILDKNRNGENNFSVFVVLTKRRSTIKPRQVLIYTWKY